MNWRTVRAIRRGRRRGESGQAFSELAVSLVMIILPAFVGFLIVAVLCTNGVANTILARESADRYCAAGWSSRAGTSILTWSEGHDNVPFTEDDVRLDGSTTPEEHKLFSNQLLYSGDSDKVRIEKSDLMPHATEFSHFYQFASSDFFVRAANLNRGASTSEDPFSDDWQTPDDSLGLKKRLKGNVSKLEPLIQSLFGVENFHIRAEEAYMPARPGTTAN